MQIVTPQANPSQIWWMKIVRTNQRKSAKLLTLTPKTTGSVHRRPEYWYFSLRLMRRLNGNLRTGHEMKIKVPKLVRSSSTFARYWWFPVVFRRFFAILVRRIDERVSFMTNGSNRRYTALMLSWGNIVSLPFLSQRSITCIIWIHCIHFHSSLGFISIHPENTGPSPVPPSAVRVKTDIGSPRLQKKEVWHDKRNLHQKNILLSWPYISDCSSNHGRRRRCKRAL